MNRPTAFLLSLLSVAAPAALAAAADAPSGDVDAYLSDKPASDRAVGVSAGGLHADTTDKRMNANGVRCSTCAAPTVTDAGLADAQLGDVITAAALRRAAAHRGSSVVNTGETEMGALPPGSTSAGTSKSAPAGASSGAAFPPFLSRLKFDGRTFPNLKSLPEHNGPHGVIRMHAADQAWAVGFKTTPNEPPGSFAAGHAAIGISPKAVPDPGCLGWGWISAGPGQSPVSDACAMGPIGPSFTNLGFTIDYVVMSGGANPTGINCVLRPGRTYYFNLASSGWDRKQDTPTECDTNISSPLGDQNYQPDN